MRDDPKYLFVDFGKYGSVDPNNENQPPTIIGE